MSIISEIMKKWADENEIALDEVQLERFEDYAKILVEWNEKINLTAITEPEEIAVKHFIDSLTVLKAFNIKKNASIIDVGTGAGFPSVPLKIVRDDIQLTMLDSLNKRINFLNQLCDELGIKAETIHSRAEDASRNKPYRESFDIAVSRAVANLPSLCEYCIPFVKKGGSFIAMKGKDGLAELESAKNAISILGGKCKENNDYITLPDGEKRIIFIIDKVQFTPEKYPRRGVKINKLPL